MLQEALKASQNDLTDDDLLRMALAQSAFEAFKPPNK